MLKSRSNSVTLALACLGCLVALITVVEHYLPDAHLPGCSTKGGCSEVLKSDLGHVGPIPIGVFGAGMYIILAGLCRKRRHALSARRQAEMSEAKAYAAPSPEEANAALELPESTEYAPSTMGTREPAPSALSLGLRSEIQNLDRLVWLLALAGTGISWWLQYAALYQIRSFCPYCFASAALITLIFLLASRDYLLDGRELTGEQKMLGAVGGFVVVCMAFVYVPSVLEQYSNIKRMPHQPLVALIHGEGGGQDLDPAVIATKEMGVKGDPNAPFTIVEFADYQCGWCAAAAPEVEEMLKAHPNQFRFGFRNFPLPGHTNARQAAICCEAAGMQGKFWEMHDILYKNQKDLENPEFDPGQFKAFAQDVGLDVEKWDQSTKLSSIQKRIEADEKAGIMGEVQSTPTFFLINAKHKMWRFVGIQALVSAVNDPKNVIYQ